MRLSTSRFSMNYNYSTVSRVQHLRLWIRVDTKQPNYVKKAFPLIKARNLKLLRQNSEPIIAQEF